MSLAIDRRADTVWVVNVGDLKPYEMNIEFFLSYGWNSTRWSVDNLDTFVIKWATREFDVSDTDSAIIADIIGNVTRYNARRKPELLNGTTYSLVNYRE
jgi:Glycosyl hydrolase family 115